jgi:gliding motility-associated-like protein
MTLQKILFILLFGLSNFCFSQNLVPNHNFDELPDPNWRNYCCGDSISHSQTISATVINQCARYWNETQFHGLFGIVRPCFDSVYRPGNGIFPTPVEGSSVMQHIANAGSGVANLGRYPRVTLKAALEKDENYCVEFSIMHSPISTATTINPGVFFSDTILSPNDVRDFFSIIPPVFPQIHFPGLRIANNQTWYHLKQTFVAHGGEQYLFLGSFVNILDTPAMFRPSIPIQGPWGSVFFTNHTFWIYDAIYCYKCSDTLFTVNIGRDTLLCPGESVALHAYYEGFKLQDTSVVFNWQTPTGPRSDSTVVANTPGYYEVEVVINHRFRARHGVWVHFGPEPPTQDRYLPEFIELCEGHDTVLSLPNWDTTAYQWSTGTTGPGLRVALPGTYTVVAENFCWDHEESVTVTEKLCDQRMWIPNAFSPNGDGINDRFEIRGTWQTPIALWIFDRWGNVVFHSEAYQNDWAGTLPNGQPAMPGVYTWKIAYRNTPTSGEREKHGTVVIVP